MKPRLLIAVIALGLSGLVVSSSAGERQALPRALAQYDTDKDGRLSADEREALKQAMEDRRKALIAKHDTNGDGILDAAERLAARDVRQGEIEAARTKRFAEADTDGDGSLSQAELAGVLKNLSEPRVAAIFDRLDADDDAAVSLDEFLGKAPPRPPAPRPPVLRPRR